MKVGGLQAQQPQTQDPEVNQWLSMAMALAHHDPKMREELDAFNALPEKQKVVVFRQAENLVSSIVVNKQVKNQLGVLGGQDIVVLFKVKGILLFSSIANELIDREYDKNKLVIAINHEANEAGDLNITAELENPNKGYVKNLLEKYNLTAEQVVEIADGLIKDKYKGETQSFSINTVAEKTAFVEEMIAAVIEGVEELPSSFCRICIPKLETLQKLSITTPQSSYVFLTPAGQPITLPGNATDFYFSDELNCQEQSLGDEHNPCINLAGYNVSQALQRFTLEGRVYDAIILNNGFLGYFDNNRRPLHMKPDMALRYEDKLSVAGDFSFLLPDGAGGYSSCNEAFTVLNKENGKYYASGSIADAFAQISCEGLNQNKDAALKALIAKNKETLNAPLYIRVADTEQWHEFSRRFYLDKEEQLNYDKIYLSTTGGGKFFIVDKEGYINIKDLQHDPQKALVSAAPQALRMAIAIRRLMTGVIAVDLLLNSNKFKAYKIGEETASDILLEEAKTGELSGKITIKGADKLRHNLVNKIATEALTPDELRVTVGLLYHLNDALAYVFSADSKYPYQSLTPDELKLDPYKKSKMTPAQGDEYLLDQLEYRHKNDPGSLTEEEKKLYFDLRCKLRGDCTGGEQGNQETIITGVFEEKEYQQALIFGSEHGGGKIHFYNSEPGIEGVFEQVGTGLQIPVSFKSLPTDNVKNIFREINTNAEKIWEAFSTNPNSMAAKHCVVGEGANTYIRVDAQKFSKVEIINYYKSIPPDRRVLLFGRPGIFKEIKIVGKDGGELVFVNYNLVE